MRFFHVDRKKSLEAGQTVSLVHYGDVDPPELQQHIDELFPSGVTAHGELYMLQGERQANGVNEVIELLCEYVRRSHYAARPSRFQSFFGRPSLDDAKALKSLWKSNDAAVWECECETAFRADMNLLTLGNSPLMFSYNIHRYWKGESGDANPTWEVLASRLSTFSNVLLMLSRCLLDWACLNDLDIDSRTPSCRT